MDLFYNSQGLYWAGIKVCFIKYTDKALQVQVSQLPTGQQHPPAP